MDPASIVTIVIASATLLWNIYQSYKLNHFTSECTLKVGEGSESD